MTASDSNSFVVKRTNASSNSGCFPTLKVSNEDTKLLFLAEQLANFGSWELNTSQTEAIWSPGMFRIFGVEPQAKGFTWEEYLSFIVPEDSEAAAKNAQVMLSSPLNHKETFDYRIRRPDGSIRMLHSQRQVIEVDEQGKATAVVGVDQDVTEQWKAEESLKRSEERFRAVAEAANVMVYEYNMTTGKVQSISGEEKVTGYRINPLTSTIDWVISRIHPDDAPHVTAALNKAMSDPNVGRYSLTYRFKHKNGYYVVLKDTAKAVKDQNGKTVLFIGGIRDITQRTKDRQQIEQYSKHLEDLVRERTKQLIEFERLAAIGQVAGMVGHDIRNPLQALQSEAYLIQSDIDDVSNATAKADIQESIDSIEHNISYIDKIVADLQDYSRKLVPEFAQVDLAQLIVETFHGIAVPDKIELAFNIKDIPLICTDGTFTRRALTNLVNNAIQAMPDGGNLTIDAYQTNSHVCITVADTGVGISDEDKVKIFTPMFTTKAKGQGLGLAVVKRLVEAQGGTIRFESQRGKGTKFYVELPIRREPKKD